MTLREEEQRRINAEHRGSEIVQGKQESNPTPMNARCGLEDCDCEYTIGGLLRRLELIAEMANHTVKQTRDERLDPACGNTCDTSCPCYQAGYEAERRPLGA